MNSKRDDPHGNSGLSQAQRSAMLEPSSPLRRRQAIDRLIQALPGQFQATLRELYRRTYSDSAPQNGRDEIPLFEELRRSLNLCASDGLLARRHFLQITYLIASTGLLAALFPKSAQAGGPMMPFAMWKTRNSTPTAPSGYPANTGSDPYWDYVVLLMNMDTASGVANTVFADESNVGKTPTINGSPYIDTTASTSSPYSGRTGSSKFNGSGDYLSLPSSSDYAFGSGDFTIECWFKTSASGVDQNLVNNWDYTNTQRSWSIHVAAATNKLQFQLSTDSTSVAATLESGSTVNNGQWHHVAAVRYGNTFNLYLDGVLQIWTTISGALYAAQYCDVGRYANTTTSTIGYLNGSLADLRIYKGIAKYTAGFTPRTTPIGLGTANDKYWGYCVLACPFENSLKDMSGKRAISGGSAALSTAAKKYGTASLSLDGSSKYLNLGSNQQFSFGGSDFTIDLWWNPGTVSGYQKLVSKWFNTGNQREYDFQWTGTQFEFAASSDGVNADILHYATASLSAGTWYHIAIVRKSSLITTFVNGAAIGSSTTSLTTFASTAQLGIGTRPDDALYLASGAIDSLRITKGFARYTSNFTPPTAAFPVGKDETVDPFWTYTVLAMHMDDFTDSTGRHALTNNNAATNNTTTYKFGTASASLNGSTQYLTTPSSNDFAFGTSDFTLEGWIRLGATGVNQYLFSQYTGSYNGLHWSVQASNTLLFSAGASGGSWPVEIGGSTTLTNGTWYHVAITRSGTTFRQFVNGMLQTTTATSATTLSEYTSAFHVGIASWNASTNPFNGFLDDLRITKGIARYTQNFTPPTRAFATTPLSTYADYDPFWSQTVLLMHMDGANGSSSFVDETARHTFTTSTGSGSTTPTLSTTQSKIGAASLAAPGGGYVAAVGNATDWNLSGQFTIETYFYPTSMPNDAWFLTFGYNTNGRLGIHNSKLCWNTTTYNDTSTVVTNAWQHAAITRDAANTTRIFLNGTLAGTLNNDTTSYANSTLRIGSDQQVRFVGYVDETRITAGTARYTAAFAPPKVAHPNSAGIVTSGLVALLDAGDAASYDGTSQTWKNICMLPADSPATFLNPNDKHSDVVLSNNSLTAKCSSASGWYSVRAITGLSTGKWYWEINYDATDGNYAIAGISAFSASLGNYLGATSSSVGCQSDGHFYNTSSWSTGTAWAYSYSTNDRYCFALDMDNGKLWVGRNGIFTGSPASGTNPNVTGITGTVFPGVSIIGTVAQLSTKFTSSSWQYSAPSGFNAIIAGANAYDCNRGSSSSAEASDPTFVGVAGGRSANDYFSFDGGDYFTLVGANTTFLNSLHKAGATFTLTGAFFCPSSYSPSGDAIISTRTNNYDPGLTVQVNSGKTLTLYVSNGSGDTLLATSTLAMATGWNFFAISLDTAGIRLFYINGSEQTIAATYSSPSSSAASQMRIGITTDLNTGRALKAGAGLGLLSLYNRALTKAELDQNFNALRSRFSI